jgi:hypothetical protein
MAEIATCVILKVSEEIAVFCEKNSLEIASKFQRLLGKDCRLPLDCIRNEFACQKFKI